MPHSLIHHLLVDIPYEWQQHKIDLIIANVAEHEGKMVPKVFLIDCRVDLIEVLLLCLIVVVFQAQSMLLEDPLQLLAAQISSIILPHLHQ